MLYPTLKGGNLDLRVPYVDRQEWMDNEGGV